MTGWNAIFEVARVKKLPLVTRLSTHHDPSPPLNESNSSRESCRVPIHELFFDNIDPKRPSRSSPFCTGSIRGCDKNGQLEVLFWKWRVNWHLSELPYLLSCFA